MNRNVEIPPGLIPLARVLGFGERAPRGWIFSEEEAAETRRIAAARAEEKAAERAEKRRERTAFYARRREEEKAAAAARMPEALAAATEAAIRLLRSRKASTVAEAAEVAAGRFGVKAAEIARILGRSGGLAGGSKNRGLHSGRSAR